MYRKLMPEVSRTEKKGSRLGLYFRVVDDVPEKKGMDLSKQMSSSKCSFTCICGIFLPFYPSTTTVYARSAFYPSLRCTLKSAVCILHTVCILPLVRSLCFTLTDLCHLTKIPKTTKLPPSLTITWSLQFWSAVGHNARVHCYPPGYAAYKLSLQKLR